MMGKFVINKRANGEFQFSLKADNGEIILASEGYPTRLMCHGGIENVRLHAQIDGYYDRKRSISGKYYFTLKASNGEKIGTSEVYVSSASMENGIASVKRNAPTRIVEG